MAQALAALLATKTECAGGCQCVSYFTEAPHLQTHTHTHTEIDSNETQQTPIRTDYTL